MTSGSSTGLKVCILIFGIATVCLCSYSHIYSPYTTKSPFPDCSRYFRVWDYIHNIPTGDNNVDNATSNFNSTSEKSNESNNDTNEAGSTSSMTLLKNPQGNSGNPENVTKQAPTDGAINESPGSESLNQIPNNSSEERRKRSTENETLSNGGDGQVETKNGTVGNSEKNATVVDTLRKTSTDNETHSISEHPNNKNSNQNQTDSDTGSSTTDANNESPLSTPTPPNNTMLSENVTTVPPNQTFPTPETKSKDRAALNDEILAKHEKPLKSEAIPKNESSSNKSFSSDRAFLSNNETTLKSEAVSNNDSSSDNNPHTNNETLRKFFPNNDNSTRNETISRNRNNESAHYITEDALEVIKIIPKQLWNGYESCNSFLHFLEELLERSEKLGLNPELKLHNLKNQFLEDYIEDCPNLLYERCFLAIAIVSLVLSTLCLSCSSLFRCDKRVAGLLNKCIDAMYHFLCGLALLAGALATMIFLYRMERICSMSSVFHQQFHDALTEFQINWHKSPEDLALHIPFNKDRVRKLHEINENLIPGFYDFLKIRKFSESRSLRSPASNSSNINSELKGFHKSSNYSKKQQRFGGAPQVKKKWKFSWTKRFTFHDQSDPEGSHLPRGNELIYQCEIFMKFYWKIAAVVSGIITAVFYIVAGVKIFCKKDEPVVEANPEANNNNMQRRRKGSHVRRTKKRRSTPTPVAQLDKNNNLRVRGGSASSRNRKNANKKRKH